MVCVHHGHTVTIGTDERGWRGDRVGATPEDCGGQQLKKKTGSSIISRDGVAAKARAKWEEVAGSSLHHSRCSVLTVTSVATDQSAGPHFNAAWAALHQIVPLFRGGPLETFVPFISTTNTYRCSMKEDADAQRVFWAHASPAKRALIPETNCSFVNKRHSEGLMRTVVSLTWTVASWTVCQLLFSSSFKGSRSYHMVTKKQMLYTSLKKTPKCNKRMITRQSSNCVLLGFHSR